MGIFRKRNPPKSALSILQTAGRNPDAILPVLTEPAAMEWALYSRLRASVPILDAAIQKIIRLTGSFTLQCSDRHMEKALQQFTSRVPIGGTACSLQSFADRYLDSLLTWGNAAGEICIDERRRTIAAVLCAEPSALLLRQGKMAGSCEFRIRREENGVTTEHKPPHPERILFTALNPPAGQLYGVSLLHGLPALSRILLRIYECIGQNYDRMGNVRYAVTYRPANDAADRACAGERARAIAAEWSSGMRSSACGEVRDFVCAGDVDIKVIGADNPLLDTQIPVRQLLEQLIAKLSIPPFLLGLNWSSTERMSAQQADILTSELEYYRRLLTPVLQRIAETFLLLNGSDGEVTVLWDNINLQDETELAKARLANAQALEIEQRCQAAASA